MINIGIIVATPRELLEASSLDSSCKRLDEYGFEVYYTETFGKGLYFVRSGVGEIQAAAATQFLVDRFSIDYIINFGVCGKISPKLKLLDTVIASSVIHYAFDVSEIDNVKVGVYAPYLERNIKTDEKLVELCKKYFPNVKTAVCASADKFVAKKGDADYLLNEFGADVCEMEAAGVLITSDRCKLPCLIVKAVSDGGSALDFNKFIRAASKNAYTIIEKIIEVL